MAANSLSELLHTLKDSIESATAVLAEREPVTPVAGGISLFDTKNELFLSYVQHLVFLVLFKVRQLRDGVLSEEAKGEHKETLESTIRNLIALRLYSERGVRPVEGRLRYEIDRVLQAVEDARNAALQKAVKASRSKKAKKEAWARAEREAGEGEEDGSGDDNEDSTAGSDGHSGSSDDEDGSSGGDSNDDAGPPTPRVAALRPNLANMVIPGAAAAAAAASSGNGRGSSSRARLGDQGDETAAKPGIYRPPRIAATSMPTTDPETRDRARRAAKAARSSTLDEYLAEELSGAPSAMPSVGSNIERGGRAVATASQRRQADERQAYEEANLMRLPAVGKKERRRQQQAAQGQNGAGGNNAMKSGFGGEDWRDLGLGAERVMRDIDSRGRASSSSAAALERSRKRRPGDDSLSAGPGGRSAFEKKRKTMMKRARR